MAKQDRNNRRLAGRNRRAKLGLALALNSLGRCRILPGVRHGAGIPILSGRRQLLAVGIGIVGATIAANVISDRVHVACGDQMLKA